MYKLFLRNVLFLFPPEFAHKISVLLVKLFFKIPFINYIVRKTHYYHSDKTKTEISGLIFQNKVGLAAGFDKNADFYNEFASFGFSFIEIGTVTPRPQPGNPKPRLFRLKKDEALINRMGFNNKGVHYAAEQLKKRKKNQNLIIGGNIGKNTDTPNEYAVNDYLYCFNVIYDYVDYLVINVSCPNIAGLRELQEIDSLSLIMERIIEERKKKSIKKPVFLKISPDLSFNYIDQVLKMCNKLNIDGLIATNTTTGRDNLTYSQKTIASMGNGGLSGKPLKNRSTEIIRYISNKTDNKLPIIGVGGIHSVEDALEKINAGAWLLQIYTGFIYSGPAISRKINRAVEKILK
jgi:dihydroorotate dehydrogenase